MSLVEYNDPDGLFPVLWPLLSSRLPLKNLSWKNSSRPARSIASLQVHFEPLTKKESFASSEKDGQRLDKAPPKETPAPQASSSKPSDKSRRHQIPGLHQTPYLRLFILRCDDKEHYKSTSRELLREWFSEIGPTSQGPAVNKQGDHDACDWLILHVVIPDTPAAAEPRWSKRPANPDDDGLREKSSGSRWTGRGTTTILERLRADFNVAGKNAIDRIAQLRLHKDSVPASLLPALPPVGPVPPIETLDQYENAWNDLISKFKNLILRSFDLRVTQYEEDIRERDAQRALPGWNFNTFFVLKEGLAMAFESVGLTEDALAGYDELFAGLELTMREALAPEGPPRAHTFPFCTPELQAILKSLGAEAQDSSNSVNVTSNGSGKPLSATKKPYRDRIVENSSSLFDFLCYIFSRQTALLLKLANGAPSQDVDENGNASTSATSSGDITPLIDLCRRGINLVTTLARVMRKDLYDCATQLALAREDIKDAVAIVVSSFNFSVLDQLLQETQSSNLPPRPTETSSTSSKSPGRGHSRRSASPLVKGRSSLALQENVADGSLRRTPSPSDTATLANPTLQDLAGVRAELFLLQRKALEATGRLASLDVWKTVDASSNGNKNPNVDTNDESSRQRQEEKPISFLSLIESQKLKSSLASFSAFKQLFMELTGEASWHFTLARRFKTAENLSIDLATLKFNEGDYAAASAQLSHILPSYTDEKWSTVEAALLDKYAQCLKALHRRDEYVRTVLSMIAKAAEHKRSTKSLPRRRSLLPTNGTPYSGSNLASVVKELISYSQGLPYELFIPATNYFKPIHVERSIYLFRHRDGFRLCLNVQQMTADELPIDKARVRLVSASASQMLEIWLQSNDELVLGTHTTPVWLSTNTTTPGTHFIVDYVAFQCGKIVFKHETLARVEAKNVLGLAQVTTAEQVQAVKDSTILCYPRVGSFEASIDRPRVVRFNEQKSIDIEFGSGMNDIFMLQAAVRSSSAGLRLRTADAKVISGDIAITDQSQPGVIKFDKMMSHNISRIALPYSMDDSLASISLRIEFRYSTSEGDFIFLLHEVVETGLLLDINVQDVFKANALFSRFLIAPAISSPCHILRAQLGCSGGLSIDDSVSQFLPTMALSYEPACITYRIEAQKSKCDKREGKSDQTLSLTVDYRTVEEDVIQQISKAFAQDLEDSASSHLSGLLKAQMKIRAKRLLSRQDLEAAAFMSEAHVPSFQEMAWTNLINEIPEADRKTTQEWLRQWHEAKQSITLWTPDSADYCENNAVRQLKIEFQIPNVKCLHTASIQVQGRSNMALHPIVASVGDTLLAEMRLKYTRAWSFGSSGNEEEEQHFAYEILADPNHWIIGGQHKAQFSAREDEETTFQLLLIPICPGQLLLPTVEVVTAASAAAGENAIEDDEQTWSCETDCITQSQTVLVVESLKSTTVGLGQGEAIAEQVDLLESEAAKTRPG